MECNKEEAVKARTIAEKKLVLEDYTGARKFILKAQHLDPNLGGLHHFMAVLDVQSTAHEISDQLASNWHKILQVSRSTDEEAIRKQYKKLILLLHPDKNKFHSASAAFKIVKDAFDFFEKERDLIKAISGNNGNISHPKEGFFWTECTKCKAPSEVLISFECQYVQCRYCLQPFLAAKIVASQRQCSQNDCHDVKEDVEKPEWADTKKQDDRNVKSEKEDNRNVKSGGVENQADLKSAPLNGEKLEDPKDSPDGEKIQKSTPSDCEGKAAHQRGPEFNDEKYAVHTRSAPFGFEGQKDVPHTRSASSNNGTVLEDQEIARSGGREDGGDQMSTLPDVGEGLPHGKSSPLDGEVKVGDIEQNMPCDLEKNITKIESDCAKEPSNLKSMPSDNGKKLVEQINAPFNDGLQELNGGKKPEDDNKNAKGSKINPLESTHDDHVTQNDLHEDISGDLERQIKSDKNLANKKRSRACIGNDSSSSVESRGKKRKKLAKEQKTVNVNTHLVMERGKRSQTQKDEFRVLGGSSVNTGNKDNVQEASMKTAYVPTAKDVNVFEKLKMHIMKGFNADGLKVIDVERGTTVSKSENIEGCSSPASSSEKFIRMNLSVIFQHSSSETLEVNNSCKSSSEGSTAGGVDYQVPESDIYDFDLQRKEETFEPGQIWAVYDDDDGLPRFYAYIEKVVSVHPFSVLMKWLYPSEPLSREVRKWVDSGLAYTCGEFELREVIKRNTTSIFSHLVAYEVGQKANTFKIFPQRGDVWAIYNKWKPRPNTTHDCIPVLVVSQFNEDTGIVIVPLFRVDGYRSVFYVKEEGAIQCIPGREITRFSHQIPAHHLGGGDEALGLPDNSYDLDTSALSC